jgi:arylsulfatase A-like enzyme
LYEKEERIARWRDLPPGKNGQNNPVMAAMVERLDSSVGRILDKIKELGIEKETVVIFTSDNGGLPNVQDEKTGKPVTATSNLPWRGGKSQLYEGGIRVPLLIRWPGVTKPDTVCGTPVSSMDLFPTFLEMAGLPPLPDQHLDGLSLAPLFEGGGLKRNNLFWHFPHYHTLPPHGAVRSGHWKLVLNYETDTAELFDLEADPGEKKNLARNQPGVVKTLRDHLARHLEAVAGQMPRPNPDCRPERKDKGIHTPYDTREGDPSQEKRPVSTNPENGATLPTPE